MKLVVIKLIRFYQKIISLDQGIFRSAESFRIQRCAFYPTCSEYAILSIEKHGLPRGLFFSLGRILRCHPWQKNHLDPVK